MGQLAATKPYYGGDPFTSFLRWGILIVVLFIGAGFLMLLALNLDVRHVARHPKYPRWVDGGAPDEIELPPDRSVQNVTPFDQDWDAMFDQDEWEERLMADD